VKRIRTLGKLFFFAVPWMCAADSWADVELVRDGRPMADIVVETGALSSVKLAASDLQEFIEKMSGAKLAINHAPSDSVRNHVYVGPGEYVRKLGVTIDDLKPEGFKIVATGNAVVLIGRDEQRPPFPYRHFGEGLANWWKFAGEKYAVPFDIPFNSKVGFYPHDATGTLYASSELLEQLGVRFYAPYENGTVVPDKQTVVVADQALSKSPVFPIRQFAYYPQYCDSDALKWFKRLKYGSSYAYGGAHATHSIICMPEQKAEHPEYFAEANGKRLGSIKGGVPRFSDASFRRSSINFLNKTFEAYPGLVGFDLMPTDGLGRIDERDAKIWSRPGRSYWGRYSDYIWDYWLWAAKELKKSHPDKYLVCWSYEPYAEPPAGLDKLPENVAMYFGQQGTPSLVLPQGKAVVDLRAKWLSMLTSKRLYVYDYYNFYDSGRPRYPVFFTRFLQQDMQALAGVCEGKNIEIASEYINKQHRLACPGLTHLLHYWQGKLYWDPNMDRQRMLDEYCTLYFGPARGEMKEFYDFAEEVWMRPQSRSVTATSGFVKQKDVDRYFEILDRARQKAEKGTVYDNRIAQIEGEMQPLKTQFANLKRTGPAFQAYTTKEPVRIDGDLQKPFWRADRGWPWYTMGDLVTGREPDKNRTSVSFRVTPDGANLVVGVVCDEGRMDRVQAKTKGDHDDPDIFNDDVVEVYLETPERSYFKIVVNPEGKIWDESQDVTIITRDTLPVLWNPGIKAAVKKETLRWTTEILIPTKDFGLLGPTPDYPWGINVGRTRRAGGDFECFAISPTGEMYFANLSKMGNLVAR